ncbi:acyl carrier protein [Mycoplasmopsis bovigenitalium]|uniref:Acyl carrier protein n=1 Tax=Mycoplasmopsis bovigenitalium TaxID=2112 RepID=A0A449AA60_9BACT|nr:phosphopantetheine-binding protein [Mycoplasmopsis bovigenitalium]VEU61111.1 acyl carrier protein [Mycoplasmopsis bovigenitalium]
MNIKDLVISRIQKYTKTQVNMDSLLKELKIDSLTLAELVFELEEELKIRVSDDELINLQSIGDVVALIEKTMK